MSEIERTINRGLMHMSACVDNIEQGNKYTAIAFFKITQSIIKEYPKQTEYLSLKYQKAKELFEAKYGDLEKELGFKK